MRRAAARARRPRLSDTVAVAAAVFHQARALHGMQGLGDLAGRLGPSRFNRRRHAPGWPEGILALPGELFVTGEAFTLERLPPVGRRGRARP